MVTFSREALRQGELQLARTGLTADDFKKILLTWTSRRESRCRKLLRRFKGGVDGILALLPPAVPISRLDISDNRIGNEGTSYIHLLPSTVVVLRLRNCGLTAAGFRNVCEMMKTNTSIMMLSLGDNRAAGDEAAKHLGEMLKQNTTLKHLVIIHCSFSPVGYSHISDALKYNDSLELLSMYEYDSPVEQHICNLCPGLATNQGLEILNLFEYVSVRTQWDIARALEQNVHLKELTANFFHTWSESYGKINYYLKLNRLNRKLTYEENSTLSDLRDAIIASSEADCLDAIFWFVRNKPEICLYGISS